MKFIKPPKLELLSFLISIPFISVAFNLIFYDERIWKDADVWLYSFTLIILIGSFSWYSHVLYAMWIERKYSTLQQSSKRIFMRTLIHVVVMTPSVLFIFFVYDYFHILGYQFKREDLLPGLLVGFCVNIIFETLYEADFIFSKLKESAAEKESLAQLSLTQEFDTLKNQVNPHFLFNCFNTLSSLITVDKVRAELFLNELSKVYRYLLRNNKEGVGTVLSEIKFIQSYFQLLQTRYGDSVKLNIHVDKRYDNYLLPSLTLQLLVENVVKHNALSKNKPLVIDIITTEGNKMVVNNNIQHRTVKAPGAKIGLENIRAKYEILKQQGFRVMDDSKNFTVILPLIWNNASTKNQSASQQEN